MFSKFKFSIAGAAAAALMAPAAFAEEFITIGTGGVTGVYYPTGGAICRLVNKNRKEHGIRCSVESTGGSVYNINTVRAGELEFGVAQSDWQFHAYNGSSKFKDQGPFEGLRAVFSVHPEPFTLIVRKGTGIGGFADLKGKKVNVGNPGSGQRATMEVVMDAFGIKMDDFALAAELKGSEMAQALCDGKIDAMIYTIGHPAAAVTEAATTCDVELALPPGATPNSAACKSATCSTAPSTCTAPGRICASWTAPLIHRRAKSDAAMQATREPLTFPHAG